MSALWTTFKNGVGLGNSAGKRNKKVGHDGEPGSPTLFHQPGSDVSDVSASGDWNFLERRNANASSENASPTEGKPKKGLRLGGADEENHVMEEGGDEFLSPAKPSQPSTEPALSEEQVGLIVRKFKEQCDELTRDHLAALMKLSGDVRSKLAIGGAFLGNCEKKELLSGSLVQAEEAVKLLKALQGDSAKALAPSPKRIVGRALPDGVSIFVGGVPRETDNEVLLTLFPRGAQIEERFRGGKGKFGFLRLSVNSNDADQVIKQHVALKERNLRVAKWSEQAPKSSAGRLAHSAQHNGRPKNKGFARGDGPVFGSPLEMEARVKNSSLVLKSLKYAVVAKELLQVFSKATFAKVMYREDGFSRGFGFVDFKSEAEATEAKNYMQGKNIAGRPVFIAYSLRQQHGDRSHPQDRRLAVAASGSA